MPLIYYIFIYKNRFSCKLYPHAMKAQSQKQQSWYNNP